MGSGYGLPPIGSGYILMAIAMSLAALGEAWVKASEKTKSDDME